MRMSSLSKKTCAPGSTEEVDPCMNVCRQFCCCRVCFTICIDEDLFFFLRGAAERLPLSSLAVSFALRLVVVVVVVVVGGG
jgi:hypothetical protein